MWTAVLSTIPIVDVTWSQKFKASLNKNTSPFYFGGYFICLKEGLNGESNLGIFWSATHVSQSLESKQCRQITICLLTCSRCALRQSLHPHYEPKHVLQHSEPAGPSADRCGWLTLPGKQINTNARRNPNESYISFLRTRNHVSEMSVSHRTIDKRGKV